MRVTYHLIALAFSLFALAQAEPVKAQRYLSDFDSTLFIRDTVRPFLQRMENLHFSGYIQPQFQVASSKGEPSFEGGNFTDSSSNRFMLRRARIKVDYILPAKHSSSPLASFTFQFDITERGAFARDVFLKLFDPKGRRLSLTMGLFARPFGYEVNLSSAYRESPERGRMSQTLMPAERDLGAMVSYESHAADPHTMHFKFDAGVFNGPGLSGPADFDSYKDLVSRLSLKPYKLSSHLSVGAGLSFLYGSWLSATRYRYEWDDRGGKDVFMKDSSRSSYQSPRHYYGGDLQLAYAHPRGRTELRGEYWQGIQSGTAATTVNPGTLPTAPLYIRPFRGGFFYFIQSLGAKEWELLLKYDWYDPNRKVKGSAIGAAGAAFTSADVRYSTFGAGLTHYFSDNVKVLAYHNFVRNENTSLAGYTSDRKDDVFTLRMQFKF